MEHVPSLGFTSLNFVADMVIIDEPIMMQAGEYAIYRGPSTEVEGIVNAVMSTGSILPIKPPNKPSSLNATWTSEFDGPMLKCNDVSDAHRRKIERNILSATQQGRQEAIDGIPSPPCTAYGFLAWTSTLPFAKSNDTGYALTPTSFLDAPGYTSAVFYIAAMPAMLSIGETTLWGPFLEQCYTNDTSGFVQSTMLACELRKSRYRSVFRYRDGEQLIFTSASPIDDGPMGTIGSVPIRASGYGPSAPLTIYDGANVVVTEKELLTALSYQSIMTAFTMMITGSVYAGAGDLEVMFNTSVASTALLHTSELNFLSNQPADYYIDLEGSIKGWANTYSPGLVNSARATPLRPLGETIEELFQNVTISMMSSNMLQ